MNAGERLIWEISQDNLSKRHFNSVALTYARMKTETSWHTHACVRKRGASHTAQRRTRRPDWKRGSSRFSGWVGEGMATHSRVLAVGRGARLASVHGVPKSRRRLSTRGQICALCTRGAHDIWTFQHLKTQAFVALTANDYVHAPLVIVLPWRPALRFSAYHSAWHEAGRQ